MAQKVKIIQDEHAEQMPVEILAEHIAQISDSMKKLIAGPLKFETLILLIHSSSKVPKFDVRKVLASIEHLEVTYLKPKRERK